MNPEESICRPYKKDINCFESSIPDRFISSEKIKDYCSFEFPSGYSIYVEEFILKDAGPNNFVLLDGKHLEYSSKLKWTHRRNIFWAKLENGQLREKSNLRPNFQCVKSLKVKDFNSCDAWFRKSCANSFSARFLLGFRNLENFSSSIWPVVNFSISSR